MYKVNVMLVIYALVGSFVPDIASVLPLVPADTPPKVPEYVIEAN